jgi:hypothetical protein
VQTPQVRRHAAEQLYLQLLALDTSAVADGPDAGSEAVPLEQVSNGMWHGQPQRDCKP